ncbi:MAG: SpoIIE family protein phosphatase [Carbonactinosporaceae bacterium]
MIRDARVGSSTEALLETMILEAPVAFALFDIEGRYRLSNQALADIDHVPVEDHDGRRPTDILPAPIGERLEASLEHVLATGQPVVDADLAADVAEWGGLRHYELRWFPTHAPDGRTVGVAVFVADITARHAADEALRRSQARTAQLQRATSELATALTVDEVVRVIARIGRRTLGADHSSVALLEEGVLRFPYAEFPGVHTPPSLQNVPLSRPALLTTAVRERRPLYVASRVEVFDHLPAEFVREALATTDEHAWAALPLIASGAPLGGLRFAFLASRKVDVDERVFLEALAGQCALAIERARLYEQQHAAAVALQRGLLPDRLPDVPGLELAYRYLPGSDEVEVGGDWYDAFVLPCGRVGAVVGDVIGKGVVAAAGMGRVRSALRALAFSDPEPVAVLSGLDRLFTATEVDESLTTLVYAVLDPATQVVQTSAAGHLPLLGVSARGEPWLVDAGPESTPLGLAEPRGQRTLDLQSGDTLVAFSDGLVENRTRGLDKGLELLVDTVRGHQEGVDTLLDRIVIGMLEGQDYNDDVTVLGLRFTGLTDIP